MLFGYNDGKFDWTEAAVETLTRLWAEGYSASMIAARMGGGLSRSAIIGKAHRLRLPRRISKPNVDTPRVRKFRKPREIKEPRPARFVPEPLPAPVEDAPAPIGQRKTLLELQAHHCRWPIGEPGTREFHFCGADAHPGFSYCLAHAKRAYQPAQARPRIGVKPLPLNMAQHKRFVA